MSTSYYAITCIGAKIPYDKLFTKTKIRVCNHPLPKQKEAEFCMECGNPLWRTKEKPIKEYNEPNDKLCGLNLCIVDNRLEDTEYVFVGKIAKASQEEQFIMTKSLDSDTKCLKSVLKNALTPLKLWEEKDFGMWTVLYAM